MWWTWRLMHSSAHALGCTAAALPAPCSDNRTPQRHRPPTPVPTSGAPAAQLKDKWGFRMTARYELYADQLAQYIRPRFKPQVIKDPSL